eukprot:10125513-Alexandrium_andersonii.AAC.1
MLSIWCPLTRARIYNVSVELRIGAALSKRNKILTDAAPDDEMIGAVRSKRNKILTEAEPDDEMQCPAPEFPPLPPK